MQMPPGSAAFPPLGISTGSKSWTLPRTPKSVFSGATSTTRTTRSWGWGLRFKGPPGQDWPCRLYHEDWTGPGISSEPIGWSQSSGCRYGESATGGNNTMTRDLDKQFCKLSELLVTHIASDQLARPRASLQAHGASIVCLVVVQTASKWKTGHRRRHPPAARVSCFRQVKEAVWIATFQKIFRWSRSRLVIGYNMLRLQTLHNFAVETCYWI